MAESEGKEDSKAKSDKTKPDREPYGDVSCDCISWLPQVKFCCCGCTLRTGVLAIAWVFLILNTIGIIVSSLLIVLFLAALEIHVEGDEGDYFQRVKKLVIVDDASLIIADFSISAILCAVMVGFNCVLLIGVNVNIPSYIRVGTLAYLFVACFFEISKAILLQIIEIAVKNKSVIGAVLGLLPELFWAGLMFYFAVVIKSYYVEVINEAG